MNTASKFFQKGSLYILRKGNRIDLFNASELKVTMFETASETYVMYFPEWNDKQKMILKPSKIIFGEKELRVLDMDNIASMCTSKPMLSIIKIGIGLMYHGTSDFETVCKAIKEIKPKKTLLADITLGSDKKNVYLLYKACEFISMNPVIETDFNIDKFLKDKEYHMEYIPIDMHEPVPLF